MAVVLAAAADAFAAVPWSLIAALCSVQETVMVQPMGVVATAGVGQEMLAVGFGRKPEARNPAHVCRSKAARAPEVQTLGYAQPEAFAFGTLFKVESVAETDVAVIVTTKFAGADAQ